MKKQLVVFLLAVFLIGCQDYLSPQRTDSLQSVSMETKADADSLSSVQIDERITYLAETDFKTWTSIVGLENRFKVCDVPDSTAKALTTNALVESIIHYPLNHILLFYNDPIIAVETIVKYSTLHRELLSRENAAEQVIRRYANARPVKSKSMLTSEESIMIEDDMFLGYFIETEELASHIEQAQRHSLGKKLEEKYEYITHTLESFQEILLEPMALLSETIGFSSNTLIRGGGTFLGNYQIRTPLFQTLDGILRSEWSDDIIELKDSIVDSYSGAILRSHSSARYNCHSFAWYQSLTSNQVWLNCESPLTNNFQLNKYWTADLYESCTSINGEIVYYPNGDHSGIVLSNGNVLSKWGDGPLVEHAPGNCPYISTNLQYYKEKDLPTNNSPVITGPEYVAPNVANTYTIPQSTNSYIHYLVTAESLNPNSSCSINPLGDCTYSLICSEYGAYRIIVQAYAYYNGITINYSYNDKYVICSTYPLSQQNVKEIVNSKHGDLLSE